MSALVDPAIVQLSDGAPSGGGLASWLYGAKVEVTTMTGEVVTGIVYGYDRFTKSVILKLPNTSNRTLPSMADYRIIKCPFIKQTVYKSKPPAQKGGAVVGPSYVDVKDMQRRVNKECAEADKALDRIGVNVTAHAQELFNALAKTMDPIWRGKDIYCQNLDVTIKEPYSESSVKGKDAKAVQRVCLVLQKELKRLGSQ
eukprot:m.152872 g.152872  ORF g.152872 m.152872 type:complete len:199 (-) comp15058_c1_seq4:1707-2303(-)